MKKHIDISKVVLSFNILGYLFLIGGCALGGFFLFYGGFGMGSVISSVTFLLWGLVASVLVFFLSKFLQLFASVNEKLDKDIDIK